MSEQRYEKKLLPGAVIKLNLEIQHAPMAWSEAYVAFRRQGPEGEWVGDSPVVDEVYASGRPGSFTVLGSTGVGVSSAEMELKIGHRISPGFYKLYLVTVETYGGRMHRYEGEELGEMAEIGFEVIKEPEEKPEIRVSFGS